MDQNHRKNYLYKPTQIFLFFFLTFLISWIFMIPWANGPHPRDSLPLAFAGYGPFQQRWLLFGSLMDELNCAIGWVRSSGCEYLSYYIWQVHSFYRWSLVVCIMVSTGFQEENLTSPSPTLWTNIQPTYYWQPFYLAVMRNLAGEASHFPPCLRDFIPY